MRLEELPLPGMELAQFERLTGALRGRGWCVVENWPPRELAGRLLEALHALGARGKFRQAGIGRETSYRHRPEIRGDRIHWLGEEEDPPAAREFLALLEALRVPLSRMLLLPLRHAEAHLAIYPPGAGYQKHLDRFADSGAREVTFSVYLNEHWNESDGGLLRLYSETAPGLVEAEIVPQLGTAVFFLSGAIWHEVTPTARERHSLTGWMRNDGFAAPRRNELP